MNKRELTKAKKLLNSRTQRTELIGCEDGGLYITAYWRDGGQHLFRSLAEVEQYLAERTLDAEITRRLIERHG